MTVVSSWGCLGLRSERRHGRLITGHEDSLPRSAPGLAHQRAERASLFYADCVTAEPGTDVTDRAMAQMKPTISRAIAVVTTTFGFPAMTSRR